VLSFVLLSADTDYNRLIPTLLLKNKIELKIPKGFEKMSKEQLRLKYPSSLRPGLVYTDTSGAINVAINLTENEASPKTIIAYKENFEQSFKQLFPSAKWKDTGMKIINGQNVGYLELITPAAESQIYNLMFFTDLEGKLLLCTFNCTENHVDVWGEVANEIMVSLQIKK